MNSRDRVSTCYLRIVWDYLDAQGCDAVAVLGPRPVDDPSGRSFAPVDAMIEAIARAEALIGDPALGLRIGATIQPSHGGLVGYLAANCSTLGQALYRHNQYERLYWDSNTGRISLELQGVRVTWRSHALPAMRMVDECNAAALNAYARSITGRFDESCVEMSFTSPRPADTRPYERYFNCPLHFGAPTLSMVLSYRSLLLPLRNPDPGLYRLLEAQAQARLAELPQPDDFLATVGRAIAAQLGHGDTSLTATAARLAQAPRTLQRRLEASGTSYQALLDRTRQTLAESYLRDRGIHLAELALMLGFADQPTFTRAFKRWHGVSPARWRKQMQETPRHELA